MTLQTSYIKWVAEPGLEPRPAGSGVQPVSFGGHSSTHQGGQLGGAGGANRTGFQPLLGHPVHDLGCHRAPEPHSCSSEEASFSLLLTHRSRCWLGAGPHPGVCPLERLHRASACGRSFLKLGGLGQSSFSPAGSGLHVSPLRQKGDLCLLF